MSSSPQRHKGGCLPSSSISLSLPHCWMEAKSASRCAVFLRAIRGPPAMAPAPSLAAPPSPPLLLPQREVFAVQETDLVLCLCALVLAAPCPLCLAHPAHSSLPGGHLHILCNSTDPVTSPKKPSPPTPRPLPLGSFSTAQPFISTSRLLVTYSVTFHLKGLPLLIFSWITG